MAGRPHASAQLNQLFRSRIRDPQKWDCVVSRFRDDPYQVKAATGKEIALTLHGLSHCPHSVQIRASIIDAVAARACVLASHSMDEHSVAMAGMALIKLGLDDACNQFIAQIPSERFAASRMKNPHNISQIAFCVSAADSVPIGVRANAMNTWITSALLSFEANRFKVKDLCQIMHAYSKLGIELCPELSHLIQSAINKQLQYMDHVAVSSILLCMKKQSLVAWESMAEGLYATAAQQVGTFNTQSFYSLVRGSDLTHPVIQRIIDAEFPRLLLQFKESANHVVGLLTTLAKQPTSRVVVESIEKNWSTIFAPLVEKGERESVIIALSQSFKSLGIDPQKWQPFVEARLQISRSGYRDIVNGIKLLSLINKGSNCPGALAIVDAVVQTNSVDLAAQYISSLSSGFVPIGIAEIVGKAEDLKQFSNKRLLDLGKRLWLSSGTVPENIRTELVHVRKMEDQWLLNEPVNLQEHGISVYVYPEMTCPIQKSLTPPHQSMVHPGITMMKLIDGLDPEFQLHSEMLVLDCKERISDIAFATSMLLDSSRFKEAILVPPPPKNTRPEDYALQVMHAISQITC